MKYSSRAKNRSFIQSTMMPRRAALAVLAAAALTAPAAVPKPARAAGAMPGEVVVGYRDGHERVLHSADPAAAIARLRARPGVVYAVPNVVAHASQLPLPDDPGRGTQPGGWQEVQWNFLGTGFGIDAPTAWQHAAGAGHPGAAGVTVAVLDTGVASTIARGVRFAARRGAQVINLSLEFSTDVGASEIPELLDALEYAHRRGALVVAASGNEAHRSVAYPARARHVISVGATTIHGCLSDFSNDGRGLDLVAPGGGADAEIPDDPNCKPTEPPGPDIFQMTFLGTSVGRFRLPSGYEGTSMAVPHVSATAALIIASRVLGAHPTPDEIERRLETTATDLGPPGRDHRYGAGLINAGRATDPAIPVT